MHKFLLLLFFFFLTSLNFAQDMPHVMTEEEKRIFPNWHPEHYSEFGDPPSTPVRTMAEWEELQGIMITWTSFTSILRQIVDYAQDEGIVYIVCSDSNSVKNYLTAGGVPHTNLKFIIAPFNSIWIRDYGPWTVYSDFADSLKIIDWIYNRPSRPLDDQIPMVFANYKGYPIYQTTTPPYNFIATGGNFMTDGHGTGFSSKLILDENPGHTEAEIDTIMKRFMGIDRYIKMNNLPYDVIHHIDMHMKLLDEETLLVGQYPPGVADGPQIEANLQYILNNFQTCFGRPYKVVRIPMPPHNGQYPPVGDYWTYTNSIIINKTVIVPTYQYQYDTTALRIYREAMPGYRVVGINSTSIIPLSGAIHCIIKEVGVEEPIFISHAKLRDEIISSEPVEIKAFIKTKSGVADASVFWTTDTTLGFSELPMSLTAGDTFRAYIPVQPMGVTKVFYYISASSNSGRSITKPITAPAGFYNFDFNNPVPVELLSFSANVEMNNVRLNWVTSTETNNRGFEIQRRDNDGKWKMEDGKFIRQSVNEDGWDVISFVEGKGTTTEQQFYSYIDENLSAGKYQYRLKQIDFDGTYEYSNIIEADINQPLEFSLSQNYPNPFNPTTKIKYIIPQDEIREIKNVRLIVYDVLGNQVATLVNEEQHPGIYEVEFDGGNLSSGVYYYSLEAGNFRDIKKLILLK